MEQITWKVGEHLREIRNIRQLTLDDVAKLTGVSKPMLGQIERGQSSPTINTLWKISTGLKIPLFFFYKQLGNSVMVAKRDEIAPILEEGGGMKLYPLYPYDPVRNAEIYYIEFDAGTRRASEEHAPGVEEYIFVVSGVLKVSAGEKEVLLKEKQALRFRADVPHVYQNDSGETCTFYNMVFFTTG